MLLVWSLDGSGGGVFNESRYTLGVCSMTTNEILRRRHLRVGSPSTPKVVVFSLYTLMSHHIPTSPSTPGRLQWLLVSIRSQGPDGR